MVTTDAVTVLAAPSPPVATLASVPLSVTSGDPVGAAVTVGVVLASSLALYVGYGALTRVAGPVAVALLGRS